MDFCLEKGVEFVDINYLSPSAAILFGKGIEQKSIQQCVNTHAAAFLCRPGCHRAEENREKKDNKADKRYGIDFLLGEIK